MNEQIRGQKHAPAINLEVATALKQLPPVGGGRRDSRQLVADAVAIVRSGGPVVRERLAQIDFWRGSHRVILRCQQHQRKLKTVQAAVGRQRGLATVIKALACNAQLLLESIAPVTVVRPRGCGGAHLATQAAG